MITNKSILYIDDESENLIGFEASFSRYFEIATSDTVEEAQKILENNNIKVLLVDFKMPKEDGISFVLRIKDKYPDLVFILVTAFADLETAVKAMNTNIFYQFVQKPWNFDELRIILKNAVEKYDLQIERKGLIANLKNALENERKANSLKNIFLANISHEVRTPLNGIIGFSELIKESTDDNDIKEKADIVLESGNQLLFIIQDILESSFIINKELEYEEEKFNVYQILEEKLFDKQRKYNKLNNLRSFTFPGEELICSNDKNKITKIIDIIVDNAFKFADDGDVEVNIKNDREQYILSVKNTGKYIEKDKIGLIYEPFVQLEEMYSRNYGGNGLGLFIAKSYTEFIHGNIWVDSDEESGTTFYFRFSKNNTLKKVDNRVYKILKSSETI